MSLAIFGLGKIKTMLLHIDFTTASYKPAVKEETMITEALSRLLNTEGSMLCGFSDGHQGDGDSWTITAVAIL